MNRLARMQWTAVVMTLSMLILICVPALVMGIAAKKREQRVAAERAAAAAAVAAAKAAEADRTETVSFTLDANGLRGDWDTKEGRGSLDLRVKKDRLEFEQRSESKPTR